jgi:hypothetical protein
VGIAMYWGRQKCQIFGLNEENNNIISSILCHINGSFAYGLY